jgi:hypothetical protein
MHRVLHGGKRMDILSAILAAGDGMPPIPARRLRMQYAACVCLRRFVNTGNKLP